MKDQIWANLDYLNAALQRLERIERGPFTPFKGPPRLPDAEGVEVHSRHWMDRLLSRDANPYTNNAVRTVHFATADTPDVLRHEFHAAGMDLLLLETVDFALLQVRKGLDDLPALSRRDKIARINEVARKLLAMEGMVLPGGHFHWELQFPEELGEGSVFSTNPNVSSIMCSWADRVDGGIRNGRLYFAFYKNERSSGKVTFPNPRRWFEGNSMAAYRNVGKRAP